jgi:hypothetical protein
MRPRQITSIVCLRTVLAVEYLSSRVEVTNRVRYQGTIWLGKDDKVGECESGSPGISRDQGLMGSEPGRTRHLTLVNSPGRQTGHHSRGMIRCTRFWSTWSISARAGSILSVVTLDRPRRWGPQIVMRPSFLLATLRRLVIYNISRFDVRVTIRVPNSETAENILLELASRSNSDVYPLTSCLCPTGSTLSRSFA